MIAGLRRRLVEIVLEISRNHELLLAADRGSILFIFSSLVVLLGEGAQVLLRLVFVVHHSKL